MTAHIGAVVQHRGTDDPVKNAAGRWFLLPLGADRQSQGDNPVWMPPLDPQGGRRAGPRKFTKPPGEIQLHFPVSGQDLLQGLLNPLRDLIIYTEGVA